jgi:hypothetical protein
MLRAIALNTGQEHHVVDDLDQILRTLIAEACNHPHKSLERRQKLSEVHRLVMKSGKLWKEYAPYYNDALQEMWEFCCQHPEQYDPALKSVITWLDDYLKKRLRNLRDARYRQKAREITALQTEFGETTDLVANLPARADIQPVLEIWEKTLDWVQTDPDNLLCSTCFRGCSHVNCQTLILRRFPLETPWSTIAAEFNLTPPEAKDLPKVYNRKCLPLLRKFAVLQGYVEEKDSSGQRKLS